MSLFCRHKWEVKVDKFEKSILQKMSEDHRGSSFENLPASAMQGCHIVIMACEKCGSIDKTITTI